MPQTSGTQGVFFRVLGVDPAAAGATGYGVIESDGRRCRMLRFGALRATRKGPEHFPGRLREIHRMLSELIEEFAAEGKATRAGLGAIGKRPDIGDGPRRAGNQPKPEPCRCRRRVGRGALAC